MTARQSTLPLELQTCVFNLLSMFNGKYQRYQKLITLQTEFAIPLPTHLLSPSKQACPSISSLKNKQKKKITVIHLIYRIGFTYY